MVSIGAREELFLSAHLPSFFECKLSLQMFPSGKQDFGSVGVTFISDRMVLDNFSLLWELIVF